MTQPKQKPNQTKPGAFRRAARMGLTASMTAGVLLAAFALVQLGSQELTRRAEAAPTADPAQVLPVETRPLTLEESYEVTRTFVGQIEPQRSLVVSFELSGTLLDIQVDEGDTVRAGTPVATLDTRLLTAERERLLATRNAIDAQLRFANQTVARQSQLSEQGFASQAKLDEALSRVEELSARITEIEASLVANTIQMEKSHVRASFEGVVSARFVDGGESVAPGQALIEIVAADAPRARIGVPLDVRADDLKGATLQIGDKIYDATLLTLRPDIDPITRTRIALFALETDDALAFGQTARLQMREHVETPGVWVPVTTLKEGLRGQWTILAVSADNIVRAVSVQVVHVAGDQAFVRGAFPEKARLISAGPQRVTVGQTVDPKPAS
ncbi:efflux RND transporter periplasmic adaptor subunit [Primorskyibacter sp. S187A]|uniref:efflux RND transporter periplasmic adaptor subunit n=1 Tax=Primorskyibacter sp. S187A TaxID=3415130 RepID=UPI003C7AFFE7